MTSLQFAKHVSEMNTACSEKKFISVDMSYQKKVFNRARRRFNRAICKSFVG